MEDLQGSAHPTLPPGMPIVNSTGHPMKRHRRGRSQSESFMQSLRQRRGEIMPRQRNSAPADPGRETAPQRSGRGDCRYPPEDGRLRYYARRVAETRAHARGRGNQGRRDLVGAGIDAETSTGVRVRRRAAGSESPTSRLLTLTPRKGGREARGVSDQAQVGGQKPTARRQPPGNPAVARARLNRVARIRGRVDRNRDEPDFAQLILECVLARVRRASAAVPLIRFRATPVRFATR